jgi:hypothetical protein
MERRWAAASERGTSHFRLGTRKQDAMACFRAGGGVSCAIVCDGAGSADFGGEGASVVCRTMTERLRSHFRDNVGLPGDDEIRSWVDIARDRIGLAADKRGETRRAFASTLVMLVATNNGVLTAHVGDGAVVARTADAWQTLSPPENGEYASTTFFVTDDPSPRLRIARFAAAYTGFAVFSDGIENLALDQRTAAPHEPFFKTMLGPLDKVNEGGKSVKLSVALAAFLNEPRVCEKTDDDKTLLLISAQ